MHLHIFGVIECKQNVFPKANVLMFREIIFKVVSIEVFNLENLKMFTIRI